MDIKSLCQGNLCSTSFELYPKTPQANRSLLFSAFTVQQQLDFKLWNNSQPVCVRYLIVLAWFCIRLLILYSFILKAATKGPGFKPKVKQNKPP